MPQSNVHDALPAVGAALFFALASIAQASPSQVLGDADARHLLARTGFGPTAAEVQAYAPLTRARAVERLLRETRTDAVTPVPAVLTDTSPLRVPRGEDASVEERQAFQRQQLREGLELRAWWVQEMLVTPSPLTERMTLFWHNHFVSSQQKVRVARLMYRQNATFRANALGNFATLLHAASREPAMLIYLDGVQNRRGQPNENFAREVMELFTLGEGHYREQDVKDAARAFTGWSLDRERGTFVNRPFQHDAGEKTVLGRTGRFNGDDVLEILLGETATAGYVVTRLWREFVSPDPDPAEVRRIARAFRDSNYEIRIALFELLTADAFYAPAARGALVKSPVELVVGTLRQLGVAPNDALPFALAAAGMGQNLFAPPNVKGWPGGDAWINTNTLLLRKQFLERVAGSDDPTVRIAAMRASAVAANEETTAQAIAAVDDRQRSQRFARAMDRGLRSLRFDSGAWIAGHPGATPSDKRAYAVQLLIAIDTPPAVPDDANSAALVRAVLLDPAFQLK
jgi:uncharacterized protein (DUF1800 family)